jgi:hypothetical protein
MATVTGLSHKYHNKMPRGEVSEGRHRRLVMLTEHAANERKWGPFPTLRQVLEVAPASNRHSPLVSTWDNVFDQLHRLIDIACRSEEQKEAVLEFARERPELQAQIAKELVELRSWLDVILRDAFKREIDSVSELCDEVRRLRQ